MASKREERREQRKRGAASHQVRSVDFGFNFTAPAAPPGSSRRRRTPQQEVHPPRSTRKTPSNRRLEETPRTKSTGNRRTPISGLHQNDAVPSSKKRKLNESSSSSARNTGRPAAETPRVSLYDVREGAESELIENTSGQLLDMDELDGESELVDILPHSRSTKRGKSVAVPSLEIVESPKSAPGSGHRQYTTPELVKSPDIRREITAEKILRSVKTPRSTKSSRQRQSSSRRGPRPKEPSPDLSSQPTPRSHLVQSEVDDIDELSPEHMKGARPEADEIDELSPEQPQYHQLKQQLVESGVEQEEAEAIDDQEAAEQFLRQRRGKPNASAVTTPVGGEVEAEEREDTPGEVEETDELDPTPPTLEPKNRRKPKSRVSPVTQRQPRKPPERKQARQAIPVTVHRLTKPVIYDEDDTDADILNLEIPFSKRGGVNAVDVLAQICEEVLESGLETLEEGGMNAADAPTRREYRTKLRAVEAFQEELRTQLLELTVILDTNYSLGKRVRTSQKEIQHLREELLRIRAEREQIAIRADAVRIKHESDSKVSEERSNLNTSLHDIELAVERCKDLPSSASKVPTEPSLHLLLPSIANAASSKSADGGILKQVKNFNSFLERAALALEGRS
ncbi:MAG: hypothetical protein M1818_002952 [Claussenomyces sp. TS43310]|nr:MAG: hypothetical protein M1818_002952 [Claussenomyces sp. TS43310]